MRFSVQKCYVLCTSFSRKGGLMSQQIPLFKTPSTWTLPKDLPNLKAAKLIGLDTETKDPRLEEKGPGVRRDGYMVGISVAVPEGQAWYLPFAHATGKQFEKENIICWAKDNLCNPNQPKVGANILYDLDYLYHEGVEVTGPFFDVQNAEPLINENLFTYSLDSLAQRYLGEKKRETILEKECANWGFKGNPQAHIWKLDPIYVGDYAEGDAIQALHIFEKQQRVLAEQELERVFDIETRLIPMLLHMRRIGVQLNVDHLINLREDMHNQLVDEHAKLDALAGRQVDIWAAESIAKAFSAHGIGYPLTPKTRKPSFTKNWLKNQPHEIARRIMKCRELDKLIGTFIESSLLEMLVGDRIHCQFNQLRSDDSGTVTGRFSSSNPNLQFIPTRSALGKRIRQAFIPDDGFRWCKADYSQIELRLLAHFAMGPGAYNIVEAFKENPDTDYHAWCAEQAGIERSGAKTINFGLIYGMGKDKLARELGLTIDEAVQFIDGYFKQLPFVKYTVNKAMRVAVDRGYVRTILGRRRRFNLWEPVDWDLAKLIKAKPDKERVIEQVDSFRRENKHYKAGVQRAGCFKAFNAADQGSAADIMKIAMVNIWESGVCRVIRPYITVHDELDFGYPRTKEGREAVREVKHIMEEAYELKVPIIADIEIGRNWGQVRGV